MTAWIFQGNPDHYDMDTALRIYKRIFWTLGGPSRSLDAEMGDRVFMWRAGGKRRGDSGIIAVGRLVSEPAPRDVRDVQGAHLWAELPVDSVRLFGEVELEDVRLNPTAGMLTRRELLNDPAMSHLLILRLPQGTCYQVRPGEERRLLDLWGDGPRG